MPAFFRHRLTGRLRSPPDPLRVDVLNKSIEVLFRHHVYARRLTLRLSNDGNAAHVTVPIGVSSRTARDFVRRSVPWLEERLEKCGEVILPRAGAVIPVRGVDHQIHHRDDRRGTVELDGANRLIVVPGEEAHLPRRTKDFLKRLARADIRAAAEKYAATMGVTYRRISIRDQRSRWGSCSTSGDLSFSWRLILAPAQVLDYVVAHEMAHRRHMNHGPAFWRLVREHCAHAAQAKTWIKAHGQSVHRIVP
jgi:predicted metal-dependent hydrolase